MKYEYPKVLEYPELFGYKTLVKIEHHYSDGSKEVYAIPKNGQPKFWKEDYVFSKQKN